MSDFTHLHSWKNPRPAKKCAVIRYGAYGDMLQSASVLPPLKKQGYHITFYCTPRGIEAIRNDPHVDEFVVQDEDQVPNHELTAFFEYLSHKYEKVVNLCETVEGIVLPLPFRPHYHWPKEARHLICNRNYTELQHSIAGVPYDKPLTKFYPTEEERAWALDMRAKIKGPAIAWSLSGSSPHKVWPYVDSVVAALMLQTDAEIAMLGGQAEAVLQEAWANEARIWKCAGVWSIRQSMAFAQVADVVVGPETGVLNSVAMERCHKVIFLSHSTKTNLTRDWINTTALTGKSECYPCHRLHTEGWKYCNRDPEGGAACQVLITPDMAFDAIMKALKRK